MGPAGIEPTYRQSLCITLPCWVGPMKLLIQYFDLATSYFPLLYRVSSPLLGLTSEFGMRSGVPSPPKHQHTALKNIRFSIRITIEYGNEMPFKNPNGIRVGRGEWIRTTDLCAPSATLYQAKLHPDGTGAGEGSPLREDPSVPMQAQRHTTRILRDCVVGLG